MKRLNWVSTAKVECFIEITTRNELEDICQDTFKIVPSDTSIYQIVSEVLDLDQLIKDNMKEIRKEYVRRLQENEELIIKDKMSTVMKLEKLLEAENG